MSNISNLVHFPSTKVCAYVYRGDNPIYAEYIKLGTFTAVANSLSLGQAVVKNSIKRFNLRK